MELVPVLDAFQGATVERKFASVFEEFCVALEY
jgi:hypothetical protein